MLGFERADAGSVAVVESFLRRESGEPVELEPVFCATGLLGRLVSGCARARGITFGPLVFLAPLPARPHQAPEAETILERFGPLFVHECAHVWQYRREGTIIFLRQYLKSYFSGIWLSGSIREQARIQAYVCIPYETEAFRLEQAWIREDRAEPGA